MDSRADGRTLRHAHRRPELLSEVAAYLLDHGFSHMSMRPLAAHLQISHVTLLHHFESRRQLLAEAVDFIANQELEAWAGTVTQGGVADVARAVWNHYSTPRGHATLRLMFEAVGLTAADPEVFGPLADQMVSVWRQPLMDLLVGVGVGDDLLEPFAILAIAQFRGLQLELIATGDAPRLDAAFEVWLELLGTMLPL